MKKISVLLLALTGGAVFLTACGQNADSKYIGKWADASDATTTFEITKSDKGLVLQKSDASGTIAVTAQGDSLTVDGATLTLDEQKQELSLPGLFDSKIVFKKVVGEQK